MTSSVEALYKEVVLEHFRRPRNRTPLDAPTGSALAVNPVCGDQVQVEVTLAAGQVAGISARARGCSIAVASGSVMTEVVKTLDPAAIQALTEKFERMIHGEVPGDDLDERLRAFARVADLPSRQRCALLPWEALQEAIGR